MQERVPKRWALSYNFLTRSYIFMVATCKRFSDLKRHHALIRFAWLKTIPRIPQTSCMVSSQRVDYLPIMPCQKSLRIYLRVNTHCTSWSLLNLSTQVLQYLHLLNHDDSNVLKQICICPPSYSSLDIQASKWYNCFKCWIPQKGSVTRDLMSGFSLFEREVFISMISFRLGQFSDPL